MTPTMVGALRSWVLPVYLFPWPVLVWIFGCNTAVTIKSDTFLSSVSPARELSSLRGSVGTSKFVASSSKVQVVPGTPELVVGV